MSKQTKILGAALGAALAMGSGLALAESTYGYSAAGTGTVIATAKVTVTVTVPKLILLRVGLDNTGLDTLAFTAALNPGIPGGIAAAALVDGDSRPSAWNGSAPAFGTPTTQNLVAYVWTNSSGGGQLKLDTVVNTAVAGITPASITVSTTTPTNAGITHPATTATGNFAATFPRNTASTATWGYSISPASLAAAAAGAYSQTTTYTATSL